MRLKRLKMRLRTITSAIIIAITVPLILFSQYLVYPIVLALFSLIAVFELLRVMGAHKKWIISVPAYIIAPALPLCSYLVNNVEIEKLGYMLWALAVVFGYMLYAMSVAVFSKGTLSISTVAEVFLTFAYVVVSFTSLCLVRYLDHGMFLLGFVVIAAWICDSAAYIVGSLFGRHKLIPDVSPKKTVEGAIGGVVVTAIAAMLYGFIVDLAIEGITPDYLVLGLSGLILSVVAQLGDLIASLIKREHGVKDFGTLLPGHGGIMDRFDSLLAVSTIAMMICVAFPPFK